MIKIRSDTDASGFRQAKEGLHDVETASDKAGNALADVGDAADRTKTDLHGVENASEKAAHAIAGMSRETTDLDSDLGKLDRAILQSKASLALLARALADTDDAAQRLDIKKAIAAVQADLNASTKARKILIDIEPRTDPADVAKSFVGRFGDAAISAAAPVSKLLGNNIGITLGAAAGVAAAPVLASAIGSALAAGAALGVIGAGVAVAVQQDKGIQEAGKQAGKTFIEALGKEAKVLNGPIRESLGVLEIAGGRLAKSWGGAFGEMSGQLVPFVRDVVGGTERISDAFVKVAKDGDALDGLGSTFRLLADGVGDFVEITADGGPKAAANLQLIAGATGDLLRYTGMTLNSLNELASNPWVTGPIIPALRDHYVEAADATGTFAKRTAGASESMEAAEKAALGETSALKGLSDELKAQADPVFAVLKAQRDLKKAQDDTAKATKEHGAKSQQAEEALQKQALAALSLQQNIGKLGDSFNGKLSPAMRNTLRAAGLTDKAIDGLEKQFGQAKAAGDRFAKTYRGRAILDGYRNAQGQLSGLLRDLNRFDGVWTATMITNYVKHGKPGTGGGLEHGGIKGAADGGARSGLTLVGEHGPELAEIAPGGRVWSNPDTQRMLGAGGGNAGPITVQLIVDGRVLAEQTVEPLRNMVNRQAGGSAQQFFGAGA